MESLGNAGNLSGCLKLADACILHRLVMQMKMVMMQMKMKVLVQMKMVITMLKVKA